MAGGAHEVAISDRSESTYRSRAARGDSAAGFDADRLERAGAHVAHRPSSARCSGTWPPPWGSLDDIEDDGHERVLTSVHFKDGGDADAFMYVHREVTDHSW